MAPVEERVTRAKVQLKLKEEEARKEIARFDDGRREFIKRFFRADMTDPVH